MNPPPHKKNKKTAFEGISLTQIAPLHISVLLNEASERKGQMQIKREEA